MEDNNLINDYLYLNAKQNRLGTRFTTCLSFRNDNVQEYSSQAYLVFLQLILNCIHPNQECTVYKYL